MQMRVPPTGEQFEITYGDQRATAVEVGGGLREYVVGERPVLDGYGVDEQVTGARGQLLAPWPNRLEDGRYRWDGEDQQVPLTEPEAANAIHGLVRWASWRLDERGGHHVVLRHRLHPQPGWPYTLDLTVGYRLDGRGLTVRTTATNLGDRPCPYGVGAHPYLTVGAKKVDACRLHLPADRRIDTDDRGLPTRLRRPRGSLDFRQPRKLGRTKVDYAYTGLQRDADGRFRTRLIGPDGSEVALWQDESFGYVEVFTGDTLPKKERRRGLGVEPMTMPPNGLHTGTDVIRLDPGATHAAEWGIEHHLR